MSLNEQSSGVPGVHFLSPNGKRTACMTTNVSKDDVVFFDISIGGSPKGRIEAPKSVQAGDENVVAEFQR